MEPRYTLKSIYFNEFNDSVYKNNTIEITKVFDYNGLNITFQIGYNVMVNVNEMGKAFPRKNFTQIIKSCELQNFMNSLFRTQNYSLADLLQVRKSGGKWANLKVAIRIAQKLSPDFSVWLDSKTEELLSLNICEINERLPQILPKAIGLYDHTIEINEKLRIEDSNDNQLFINGLSLQSYFEKVREILKKGEKFPINLDDVWELVYSERSKAVRALKIGFIENDDFIPIAQNGGRSKAGKFAKGNLTEYFLSVPAMEFFIAKKRKEVFEVYRRVFHYSLDEKEDSLQSYKDDPFIQLRIKQIEQDQRIQEVEDKLKVIEAKSQTRPEYYAVSGYAALNNINVNVKQASVIGRKTSKICREQDIIPGNTFDPRFGTVKTYPYDILDTVFKQMYQ